MTIREFIFAFMLKVGLISDTHSHLGEDVIRHLQECDEVWHAGDLGNTQILDALEEYPLRMVFGNIDGSEVRQSYPRDQIFTVEGLKVCMTHIGGYPGRYTRRAYEILVRERPAVFISGHSHILKVMRDKKLGLLHLNPGSCGVVGFHKFRTMLKFNISQGKILDLQAVDFGPRSKVGN